MKHDHIRHHDHGLDPLSAQVFVAFKRSMHMHRQFMARMLGDKCPHPAQAGCLRILAAHDGITQRDLAEMLQVSRPTVTSMLQKMEKTGLIDRRTDERDQRLTHIHLTADGHEASKEMREVFSRLMHTSLGSMPDEDKREFARLLDSLSDSLNRSLEDPDHPHAEKGSE